MWDRNLKASIIQSSCGPENLSSAYLDIAALASTPKWELISVLSRLLLPTLPTAPLHMEELPAVASFVASACADCNLFVVWLIG